MYEIEKQGGVRCLHVKRVIVDRAVQAIKITIDIVGSAAAFRAGECQA
jgi:hypothetical protein